MSSSRLPQEDGSEARYYVGYDTFELAKKPLPLDLCIILRQKTHAVVDPDSSDQGDLPVSSSELSEQILCKAWHEDEEIFRELLQAGAITLEGGDAGMKLIREFYTVHCSRLQVPPGPEDPTLRHALIADIRALDVKGFFTECPTMSAHAICRLIFRYRENRYVPGCDSFHGLFDDIV